MLAGTVCEWREVKELWKERYVRGDPGRVDMWRVSGERQGTVELCRIDGKEDIKEEVKYVMICGLERKNGVSCQKRYNNWVRE